MPELAQIDENERNLKDLMTAVFESSNSSTTSDHQFEFLQHAFGVTMEQLAPHLNAKELAAMILDNTPDDPGRNIDEITKFL